jgi:hypothetical protein
VVAHVAQARGHPGVGREPGEHQNGTWASACACGASR